MKMIFEQSHYLYLYILAIFAFTRIPYVGVAIRLFNTLIHESSHALVAILTSGKILKIELQSNTSGSMLSVSKNKFSLFLISIAGYPMAAFTGYLFFLLLQMGYSHHTLFAVFVLASTVLLLFVRNTFGVIWSILFIGAVAYIIYLDQPKINDFAVVSLAVILATEAIFSSLMLVMISLESTKDAGDAKILNTITKVPTFIWALLFVAINSLVVYRIVVDFLIY